MASPTSDDVSEVSSVSHTCWDGAEDEDDVDFLLERPRLFGRAEESARLLKTFEQVLRTKHSSTVVVHGESGLGKTSLVDTLRLPVLESGGYFCAGKFFQNSEFQEPYSAIMAAFSDVCDIVTQSEHFDEERRNEIQQKLGDDGFLLTKAVSNITSFLLGINSGGDDASCVSGLGDEAVDLVVNERSLSKFNVACKTFMQAMSSKEHPLVIFFDDIQWMDVGSRQLIELFINEQDLKNVLLILAYREEEADKVESIMQQHEDQIVDIHLNSLDSRAIYEIVCGVTGEKAEGAKDLSQLVEKRSEGNPFHIQTFLEMIQSEGLLVFDDATKAWIFDVDEIRASVMMQSDLADILARKIDLVNPHIQETLKIASMLGFSFSDKLLMEVLSSSKLRAKEKETMPTDESLSPVDCLSQAVMIGFVEKTKNGFQFSHDRIQTAFHELILDQDEVDLIHGVIGDTILAGGDDDNATMHHAAVHLNAVSTYFESEKEQHRLVEVNLRAAKYCLSKSAFAAARDLLLHGLSLMSQDQKWSEDFFDLTFEMTELLARAELVIGDFDGCKEATGEAILHAKSTEMKINSLVLDVEVRLTTSCELSELIQCAQTALHALGVDMPRRVTKRHVLVKFFNFKRIMRKVTDEQILGLPMMNDKTASTAIKMLSHVCTSCLVQDQMMMAFYTALKSMELTLTHGLSEDSPMSLVIYAMVEKVTGNNDGAYRYAKLALKLMEGPEFRNSSCLTVGLAASLITWRKESLQDLRLQLLTTSEIAFENGDIWSATYCSARAYWFDTIFGGSVQNLEASLRNFWGRLESLRQDSMLLWIKPTFQFVFNLQRRYDRWRNVFQLTGDAMDEKQFVAEAKTANYGTLRAVIVLTLKSTLACYFQYFQEAIEFCEEAEHVGKQVVNISFARLSWLFALTYSHLRLYLAYGRRKNLGKFRKYKKLLAKLSSDGSPDAETLLVFISALEMTIKKKMDKQQLIDGFESAISHLSHKGNLCLEGLLTEQAGFELAKRGHRTESRLYIDRALDIYQFKWCSVAKHEWLTERSARSYVQTEGSLAPSQIGSVIICDKTV